MGFEHNDVVFKNRLREALNEETNMGFEHNDIVTMDVMNAAIAEGGGGDVSTATVTLVHATDPESFLPIGMAAINEGVIDSTDYCLPGEYIAPIGTNGAIVTILDETDPAKFAVTGDISIIAEDTYILITGDGTITYTP